MRETKFFTNEGKPEEEEWVKKNAEKYRAEEKKESVSNAEFEKYFEEVDLDEIGRIYMKICGKSGVVEDLEPVRRDSIIFVKPDLLYGRNGEYKPVPNIIKLMPSGIKMQAWLMNFKIKTIFFQVLCHEFGHAFERTECYGFKESSYAEESPKDFFLHNFKRWITSRMKSGYVDYRFSVSGDETKELTFGSFFDEGVTDKLSLQVMQEYLKLHPDFLERGELERLLEVVKERDEFESAQLVDEVIGYLSKKAGFGRDIIWNSIVRGKFASSNEEAKEVWKIMRKWLPKDLYDDIFEKTSKTTKLF